MPLKSVTITGADDHTQPGDLIQLHMDFPFVEWGILLSANRIGTPRYPTHLWQSIFQSSAFFYDLNIAIHVCGAWSRKIFAGVSPWSGLGPVKWCARRMQINGARPPEESWRGGPMVRVLRDITSRERINDFIFQIPNGQCAMREAYSHDTINSFGLFDGSGGLGISPQSWPSPRSGVTISCAGRRYIGYAGGLGPDNVEDALKRIEDVCTDDFWIDMESGVRTNDALDLGKVEKVLEICARRIQ